MITALVKCPGCSQQIRADYTHAEARLILDGTGILETCGACESVFRVTGIPARLSVVASIAEGEANRPPLPLYAGITAIPNNHLT